MEYSENWTNANIDVEAEKGVVETTNGGATNANIAVEVEKGATEAENGCAEAEKGATEAKKGAAEAENGTPDDEIRFGDDENGAADGEHDESWMMTQAEKDAVQKLRATIRAGLLDESCDDDDFFKAPEDDLQDKDVDPWFVEEDNTAYGDYEENTTEDIGTDVGTELHYDADQDDDITDQSEGGNGKHRENQVNSEDDSDDEDFNVNSDDDEDTSEDEDGSSEKEDAISEDDENIVEEDSHDKIFKGSEQYQHATTEANEFWAHYDTDDEMETELPIFDGSCGYRKVEFSLGQKFTTATVFRLALMAHAAEQGREYLFLKNHRKKVSILCLAANCRFKLYGSRGKDRCNFSIRYLFPHHDCPTVRVNSSVSSKYLHIRFLDHIRDNPGLTRRQLATHIQRELKLTVSFSQAYKTIKKAHKLIHGDVELQFQRIHDYCETLEATNPGSTCKVVTKYDRHRVERFQRVYIRFEAQLRGFLQGCRPFIQMDGCHLKGHYGGQLLVAIAYDANQQMFPLCFAMVEIENKETWTWFLEMFIADFGHPRDRGWVFMSDKQKGLLQAFRDIGTLEHRCCMRHLADNFVLQHKGENMKDILWNLSKSSSVRQFERQLEELRKENPNAAGWVAARPRQEWVRAYFSERAKTSIQVNNLAESFNAWILDARPLPIIPMIETIRKKLMQLFYDRRTDLDNYRGPICPNIQAKLEKRKTLAADCDGRPSWGGEYEVDIGKCTWVVKLGPQTCSCRAWQLSGIPCPHAICAILCNKELPETYVHQYYKVSTYKSIYKYRLFPVGSELEWVVSSKNAPQPPIVRKAPGRPKKKRMKGKGEGKNPFKATRESGLGVCSLCKESGHNKRTCPRLRPDATAERREKKKVYMQRKRAELAAGKASTSCARPTNKRKTREAPLSGPELDRIEKSRAAALEKLKRKKQKCTTSQPEMFIAEEGRTNVIGVGIAQQELNADLAAHPPQMERGETSRFGDIRYVHRGGGRRGGGRRGGRRGGRGGSIGSPST